jgi:general secretion pathway protein G
MLNLRTAVMMFQIDVGRCPTTQEGLAALVENSANIQGWKGPYVTKLPVDPWGNAYVYRCPGKVNADFDLFSCGPDGLAGDADDVWP